MGIKDFYKVIKQRAPAEIKIYHLSDFCGNRWAIDISIFLNKYVKSSGGDSWKETFILFLCTLKKHGIKSICVFDGSNMPGEKKAEQDRRRRDGKKAVTRMERCIEIRKQLLQEYALENLLLEEELQEECKILYGKPKKKIRLGTIDWSEWSDTVDALTSTIDSLEKQTAPITAEHRETAKAIATLMGVPVFQADGEAEGLCAFMAIHGYVDGVLTEDTDVLAYGTPWLIAFKDFKLTDEKVYAVHLPSLRIALDYSQEELLDLCILLGCDYNKKDADGKKISILGFPPDGKTRKKSVNIGMVGALAFIDEYRRLEECLPYIDNPESLIFERCREIFTPPSGEETLELIKVMPYNIRPDFDKVEEFFKAHSLNMSIEWLKGIWKPGEIVFCDSSDEDSNEINEEDFANEFDTLSVCDTSNAKSNTMREEDSKETPFYVTLSMVISTADDEESDATVTVAFKDKQEFEGHEDCMFDELIEPLTAFFQDDEATAGSFVDGEIEIQTIHGHTKIGGKILVLK